MAMIKCTECGHTVSDKANACPECGCPVSEILKEIHKKTTQYRNSDGLIEIGSIADALCRILENCPDDWPEFIRPYRKGSKTVKEHWAQDYFFLLRRYLTEDAVKSISNDPSNDYWVLCDYINNINTRFEQ